MADLIKISDKVYTKDYLRNKMEKAILSLKIRKTKHDEYGKITVLGMRIKIPYDSLFYIIQDNFKFLDIKKVILSMIFLRIT